jgi:hypothetical protein
VRKRKVASKAVKVAPATAVQTYAKKRRANPKTLALAHFAAVLEDQKASPARKDKAARLLLTHSASPAKARRAAAAAAEPGKKDQQREAAQTAGKGGGKWAGLLQ